MKKFLFSLLTIIATSATVNAQSQFEKGDVSINVNWVMGASDFDSKCVDNTMLNGVGLLGEYGFMNVINSKGTISAGVLLGFQAGSTNGVDLSRVRIGTRGTLHYAFIPQLDTYAGINFLFVDINKAKYEYSADGVKYSDKETDTDVVAPALVAGCRYMVTSFFGVNAEVSWDKYQLVSLGLSFKF